MVLVTGGAGFIGANFILQWLAHESDPVVSIDKLTYAGNPANLASVRNDPRYVAFARELRDRWVEAIGRDPSALLPQGKYALARALPASAAPTGPASVIEVKALPAAA